MSPLSCLQSDIQDKARVYKINTIGVCLVTHLLCAKLSRRFLEIVACCSLLRRKKFKMNIECTRRSFSNVFSASIQVPVVQGSCFFEHKNNKQNGNEQRNDHLATATRCCNRISGHSHDKQSNQAKILKAGISHAHRLNKDWLSSLSFMRVSG